MYNVLSDLASIEKTYGIDNLLMMKELSTNTNTNYYLQFNFQIRNEACLMAKHYELFYCLEKSIREMITDILESSHGLDWWEKSGVIIDVIKQDVAKNIKREIDSGMTRRSFDPLDYTTFGQLGEIIKTNWDLFGGLFSSIKAIDKVLFSLNTLRNPIALLCFGRR